MILPIITNALSINKKICIDSYVNIITSEEQIQITEYTISTDEFKLYLLQKTNTLIKNCIPTLGLTSFIKCSLYII